MISLIRNFRVARRFIVILLILLSSGTALAGMTIRVGVYDCEPLSRIQTAVEPDGFMIDVLKYIALEEKWRLQFLPVSQAEGWRLLNSGRIDLLVAATYSETQARYYDYTQTTVISTWAQIYHSADHPVIQSLLDLKNLTIGLVKEDPYNQELRDVTKRLNVPCKFVEFKNYGDLFKAIRNKWVDAGAVDRFYGILHRKEHGVVDSPIIFSPVEFRYATAKNRNAEVLQTINYHLGLLKRNPDSIYYQLVDKMAGTSRDARQYKVLFWSIVLTVCFLCILALIIFMLRSRIRKKTIQLVMKNDELERENAKRRHAEGALRESEELYRTLAERSFTNVYVIQNGRFCFVNSNTVKTFGYPPDEIIGQRSLNFVHEDDREQVKTYSHDMLLGHRLSPYEYRLVTHAGEQRWMLETVTTIQYAGRPAVLGTAMDISEQKKAEVERQALETQLRQAQKMEAIGTLAGGIAHDFNNILAAIIGYAELAYLKNHQDGGKRYLEEVLKACERARELIKQILTFSRSNEQTLEPVHITAVIKEAAKLLRASLPATIDIRLDINAQNDVVRADPTQIHQVLMNLCTNAAHSMNGKGGRLTIGVGDGQEVAGAPSLVIGESRMQSGPCLELRVSDTGHGIPKTILDRIFDPFFTTKEVGKGTGMGLSVVHGIVKSHSGWIHVESEPDLGSTFRIFLPFAERACRVPAKSVEIKTLPVGQESILLVDDETALVDLGREMLSRLGYRVTTATGSLQALELFSREPGQFDLVMTDMTMPQMTGLELARKLVEIRSDIHVVLCTGYSEDVTKETLNASNIKRCLMKPFRYAEMAQLVRRMLDEQKDSDSPVYRLADARNGKRIRAVDGASCGNYVQWNILPLSCGCNLTGRFH